MPPLPVCLTFDFDALSPWVFEMALGNVAALSRGEFGAYALPRILDLLERHDVPATDVSANTVDILVEHGFLYGASFSAIDFEP